MLYNHAAFLISIIRRNKLEFPEEEVDLLRPLMTAWLTMEVRFPTRSAASS